MGEEESVKQEVARLNEVVQQQSLQHAVPTSQTPREKQIMKATKTWFREIVSEGVQAVTNAVKILERIKGIEEM